MTPDPRTELLAAQVWLRTLVTAPHTEAIVFGDACDILDALKHDAPLPPVKAIFWLVEVRNHGFAEERRYARRLIGELQSRMISEGKVVR